VYTGYVENVADDDDAAVDNDVMMGLLTTMNMFPTMVSMGHQHDIELRSVMATVDQYSYRWVKVMMQPMVYHD
jgi:hypothetical protein